MSTTTTLDLAPFYARVDEEIMRDSQVMADAQRRAATERLALEAGKSRPRTAFTKSSRPVAAPSLRIGTMGHWPPSFQPCTEGDRATWHAHGTYPPCWRVGTESGGNYSAYNPGGCGGHGCFGKWQFSGAWACKLGLPCDIRNATPAQQDAAAAELWAGGEGCENWVAC